MDWGRGMQVKAVLVALVVCVVVPAEAKASGSTLSPVARTKSESKYNQAPWDLGNWLGLTGPGDGFLTWHTDGAKSYVNASVMNNVSWWQVWRYGSTNSASDTYTWVDIYRLTGTPGHSASISLGYEFEPYHLNYAVDGRSRSVAHVQMSYGITDADVSTIDKLLAYNAAFPADSSSQVWDYTKNYYVACFTWGDDLYTGTLPLGTATVGDYVWFRGTNTASVEAQAYGPGFTGAVAISPFEYWLTVTDIPPTIPEPGTMVLTAIGVVSLALHRRRLHAGR
jgi:hypothetical protein